MRIFPMNEPIQGPFHTGTTGQPITSECAMWKLNLTALDVSSQSVFIAHIDKIVRYRFKLIDCVNLQEKESVIGERLGVWSTETESSINRLTFDRIAKDERCLVAVKDDGLIFVFFLSDSNDIFNRKPVIINNNGISTWGIALSKAHSIIAVSANDRKIRLTDLTSDWRGELMGHRHNIPCICYSSCGQFIVSASIDSTCRMWDIKTGCILFTTWISSEWGWSVSWMTRSGAIRDEGNILCSSQAVQNRNRMNVGFSSGSREIQPNHQSDDEELDSEESMQISIADSSLIPGAVDPIFYNDVDNPVIPGAVDPFVPEAVDSPVIPGAVDPIFFNDVDSETGQPYYEPEWNDTNFDDIEYDFEEDHHFDDDNFHDFDAEPIESAPRPANARYHYDSSLSSDSSNSSFDYSKRQRSDDRSGDYLVPPLFAKETDESTEEARRKDGIIIFTSVNQIHLVNPWDGISHLVFNRPNLFNMAFERISLVSVLSPWSCIFFACQSGKSVYYCMMADSKATDSSLELKILHEQSFDLGILVGLDVRIIQGEGGNISNSFGDILSERAIMLLTFLDGTCISFEIRPLIANIVEIDGPISFL